MTKVLSTKLLSPKQKEIIESTGISLTEYNAIQINFKKFSIDLSFDNYILTSQNAVRGFLRAFDDMPLPEKRKEALSKNCFCVGEKTSALLRENGLNVVKAAKNSKELGQFIAENHKNESFLFICGNRRREDLPAILSKYTIQYKEIIAYHTINNEQSLHGDFEGVLFYSPSGVQSFTSSNDLGSSTAFCIGDSTAREAHRFSKNVIVSKEQSIESVLQSVIQNYK